ncbi:hypothetical protein [Thioalkalivibrio thiocyanodenitrificans]|uniref:hypothetical protein n=1 Tax=Thioalkalivibrio thiocyanodenitrificans TaxID=243063 RepID=UPI00039B9E10|nr:hypothetical protein [Thioalkalivibrio thiocyanodenitrificans]
MKFPALFAIGLFVFVAPLSAFGGAQEGPAADGADQDVRAVPRDQQPITRSGRLKFRGEGPISMCAMGMDDDTIERAQAEFRRNGWQRN